MNVDKFHLQEGILSNLYIKIRWLLVGGFLYCMPDQKIKGE